MRRKHEQKKLPVDAVISPKKTRLQADQLLNICLMRHVMDIGTNKSTN
jgi:hypothetical protein